MRTVQQAALDSGAMLLADMEAYLERYPAINDEALDRARAIALQSRDRAAWVAMGGSLVEWQRLRIRKAAAK